MLDLINIAALALSAGTIYLAAVVVLKYAPRVIKKRDGARTASDNLQSGVTVSFMALILTSLYWNAGFLAQLYGLESVSARVFKWGQASNLALRHAPYIVSAGFHLLAIAMMGGLGGGRYLRKHFVTCLAIVLATGLVLLVTHSANHRAPAEPAQSTMEK